MNIDLVGNV